MKIPRVHIHKRPAVFVYVVLALALLAWPLMHTFNVSVSAASLVFPIIGPASFSDDYLGARPNGPHYATDIFASKHQKVVSRTDGVVTFVGYPQPSWGYAVFIEAENGHQYWYIHLNNDNPGTDDGEGGGYNAYGPDMKVGTRVVKGQHLGYVGDSGNAENTPPHLHFEIYDKDDNHINPYHGLVNNSVRISKPTDAYPKVGNEILPSGTYRGGGSVAIGDVDDNNQDEIILGPGPGAYYVKVLRLGGTQIARFAPNGLTYAGGVDVAIGDVNGDGVDEIITGAGPGGSYVKVFRMNGQQIGRFAPNGEAFKGGVDVAAGDIDGDGIDEIITGAGPGGKFVKAFKLNGTQVAGFMPYGEGLQGGITVTSADVSGNTNAEIITGARKGGGPRVSVFNQAGTQLSSFYAYDVSFKGGIKVEAANVAKNTAKAEILTIPQESGSPRVKMFNGSGTYLDYSNYYAEEWWRGYYDIGASDSAVRGVLGTDRRTSIRQITGL